MNKLRIGFNGRFFPSFWRPALEEVAFAAQHGFTAVQFQGAEGGLTPRHLGHPLEEVGAALRDQQIEAVMEIVVRVDSTGLTMSQRTPLDVLHANLPAIRDLGCTAVHWHLQPSWPISAPKSRLLEQALLPQFKEAIRLAQEYGFRFGFEHNDPSLRLCGPAVACQQLLNQLPDLGFVWDFNHTAPQEFAAFAALADRCSLVHVADTTADKLNQHLPLGMGAVDFQPFVQVLLEGGFGGHAILEIGGQPASGGYGRDTDEALLASRDYLQAIPIVPLSEGV